MLGFGSIYHMREVKKNGHTDFWVKSIHAHMVNDTANLPSRADFDRILGDFNVRPLESSEYSRSSLQSDLVHDLCICLMLPGRRRYTSSGTCARAP